MATIRTINPIAHSGIDQLVHDIVEDSYQEVIRSLGKITDVIIWENSNKLIKIRETNISRIGNLVSQIVIKQYDSLGDIKETFTGTFNRVGDKVYSIDWVLT